MRDAACNCSLDFWIGLAAGAGGAFVVLMLVILAALAIIQKYGIPFEFKGRQTRN